MVSKAIGWVAFGLAAGLFAAVPATAAEVSWGDVFDIVTDADIDMSLPVVVEAANVGDEPSGDVDVVLSGKTVTFAPLGVFAGVNTGAGGIPELASTGNAALDQVLESHSWEGGSYPPESAVPFSIGGLNVGQPYQVQFVAAADGRGCCASRTQVLQDTADGTGNNSGPLARGSNDLQDGTALVGSVIGTFTADADMQDFWISGATDPGLSAYIVTTVPEPSSVAILALACIGFAVRVGRWGRG
jgi:hypothetical protein